MTEVTQHVTRFEKGHGTCNSDRVSTSFSKDMASEQCYKGQEELAKRIENGHLHFITPLGMNENRIEQFRSEVLHFTCQDAKDTDRCETTCYCGWYVCDRPWVEHRCPALEKGQQPRCP